MKTIVEHLPPPPDHQLSIHQAGVEGGQGDSGLLLDEQPCSMHTGHRGEDGVQGGQGQFGAGGDGGVALVLQVLKNKQSLAPWAVPRHCGYGEAYTGHCNIQGVSWKVCIVILLIGGLNILQISWRCIFSTLHVGRFDNQPHI